MNPVAPLGRRTVRVLRLAVLAVFLVPAPTYVITGSDVGNGVAGNPVLAMALAAAIGVVHDRHARAAAGSRPAGWPFSLALLVALTCAPLPWWSFNWLSLQWFVLAGVILLLPRRAAALACVVVLGATAMGFLQADTSPGAVFGVLYWWCGLALGAGTLVAVAHLVHVRDELSTTRVALADAAASAERARVGRDLHDVLGQRLSAVSLTGDLCGRLLARAAGDAAMAEQAREQLASLAEEARLASEELTAVLRDDRPTTLADELARTTELLHLGGVAVRVDAVAAELPATVDAVFGTVVREAGTNALRHADPATWALRLRVVPGPVATLIITNDGTRPSTGHAATEAGVGLDGLAERLDALGGTLESSRRGSRFRLVARAPLATIEEVMT